VPILLIFYFCALATLSLYQINRADHTENLRRLAEPSDSGG
jgi:hypothetical protein